MFAISQASSLSFARKSSSERDYHLCKYLNGEAASIEFCRRQNERNERPLTVSRLPRDFLAKGRLLAVSGIISCSMTGLKYDSPYSDTVQQAKHKAGSKPATISAPHPQTLEHIR